MTIHTLLHVSYFSDRAGQDVWVLDFTVHDNCIFWKSFLLGCQNLNVGNDVPRRHLRFFKVHTVQSLHTIQLRLKGKMAFWGVHVGTRLCELTAELVPSSPLLIRTLPPIKMCPFKYYLSCTGRKLESLSY